MTSRALVIQQDQKLVIAGHTFDPDRRVQLARYNPDGSMDITFGVGGLVSIPSSVKYLVSVLAIQDDNKFGDYKRSGTKHRGFEPLS